MTVITVVDVMLNSGVYHCHLRASGVAVCPSGVPACLPGLQGLLRALLIATLSVSSSSPTPGGGRNSRPFWAPFSSCLSESWQVGAAGAIRLPYASCYLEENSPRVPPTTRADISRQTLESALRGIGR